MDTPNENPGVQPFEHQNSDILASEQILVAFVAESFVTSHIAEPVPTYAF